MSDTQPSPEFEEQVRKAVAVPNANPEFVNKLRNELVRGPVKMKSQFIFRPAWAITFVFALAVGMVSMPGVAAALGRLLGYVPNVGLVENTGNLRMLAEPASLMREGVTLRIQNVIVYDDRVELSYEVEGIAPFNDGTRAEDASTNPTAFCGGMNIGDAPNKDGDARLRLLNGTLLERDTTGKYKQNVFAMKPVYEASIPADVTEMTLVLKCIPNARRGTVPENWEVPFKLMTVPAGTIVGNPVIEVEQPAAELTLEASASSPTDQPAMSTPVVTMTLEKIVPMESATIFYISMDMENRDPSLISIMPVSVYMIDSQGHKSQLIGNYTLQPFEHHAGSLFEFMSQSKPADGPLTVVVENAVAYYAPLYVDPPQATPEEMSFTFDVGTNPQHGQIWDLNNQFTIAGYPLKVTSARAVEFADIETPTFQPEGSQGYNFGYQFAVESNPAVKLNVWMDIISESSMCWLSNGTPWVPSDSKLLFTQLCQEKYPSGLVKVTIGELSVLLENIWQAVWTP